MTEPDRIECSQCDNEAEAGGINEKSPAGDKLAAAEAIGWLYLEDDDEFICPECQGDDPN